MKTQAQHELTCKKKTAKGNVYKSLHHAWCAVADIKGKHDDGDNTLRPFHCPVCFKWYVGRLP